MTEKRYIVDVDEAIIDTKTNREYTTWDISGVEDICDKLNNLTEENGQLKDALNQRTDQCDKYYKENEQLKKENKFLRCTIESNSQDDYIDYLEKQNERLKERITELASNDKIVFMNGQY